jgi:hypothetical protein
MDGAVGHLLSDSNDLQRSANTALLSSVHDIGHNGGYFVTKDNLAQVAVMFAVRRLIAPTWLNDRDQFLQPTEELTNHFKHDCLIWMLFNGSNLTASADKLAWNDQEWSIVNHFIPFTVTDVGASDRFESSFMVDYLANIKPSDISKEAKQVLVQGKQLWAKYHATQFERKIKNEYKLNRADVGWYQIRKALEANAGNESVDFEPFKTAYTALSDKLKPMVYSLGFLKE